MPTSVDFALLAGAAYQSNRAIINRIPMPQNWTIYSAPPPDDSTGFEAVAFQSGTQIVISYAGTFPGIADALADAQLGLGNMHTENWGQVSRLPNPDSLNDRPVNPRLHGQRARQSPFSNR